MDAQSIESGSEPASPETTFDIDLTRTSHQAIKTEQLAGLGDTTLGAAKSRPWLAPMTTVSNRIWRQLLGLNPFKASYFGLYASLDSPQDRLVACCGVTFAVAAGVPLPIIGIIFGKLISSFPPDEEELRLRIKQLLGVAVAFFLVTSAYTISFGRTGERIAIQLRVKLLSSLLHMEQAYLDTRDIDINALLREKIDTIQVGCSEKVGIFIQSMSYFVAAFTVGFILNARLTGILFATVIPAMATVVVLGSTLVSRFTRKISRHTEQATGIVESALRSVKVVQAFDMIDQISEVHSAHLNESTKEGLRKSIVSAMQMGAAFFIAYAANALAFFIGSRMAASGKPGGDAGTIYAVVFLILDASFVVGQFAPFLEIFARAASAHQEVQEALEAPRIGLTSQRPRKASAYFDSRGKDLRLENVSFAYPARPEVQALNGLNLTVHAGAFNAIVGTSGGGKSTLISLLLRIYDYSGQIFLGSQELRSFDASITRSQIAVLDQDCALFSGTIFENICHGLVGQDISESTRTSLCQRAAVASGLDFLDTLPNGIHTRIDSTLQLSGGQRQRMCLARALIKDPAILILDEPTSALDAWNELQVLETVKHAISRGTTVLMIAHRLSTVTEADHIAVISDGQVVEHGTPTELAQTDTIFRGLLNAQNTDISANKLTFSSLNNNSEDSSLDSEMNDSRTSPTVDKECELSLGQAVSCFFRLTRPEHLIILAGLFAATASGSIIIGESIIFGDLVQLLNVGIRNASLQQNANFFCLMFFVCACAALASYVCSGIAFGIASTRLSNRVQHLLLQRVLQADIEWFYRPGRSAHELISTFAKDSGDLACLSGVALGTILTVITSMFGGITLAHVVAWKIAVVLLAAVPIMLASGYTRLRLLANLETRQRTAYADPTALAIESCRNRRTVSILGLEEVCLKRFQDAIRLPYRKGLAFTIFSNTLLAFSLSVTYLVYALAYWWGSKQVRGGLYSQKEFFTVLPALLFSAQAAGQLFSLSPEIARAKAAAVSVLNLLSIKPKILAPASPEIQRGCTLTIPWAENRCTESMPKIEFRDVAFSYPNSGPQKAIDGVSFTIGRHETVAFVGPSGAGKSSTLSLLERFYDLVAGQIFFEGINLRDMDVRQLRSRLGIVPQEPTLFPGSIRYNIKLGAGKDGPLVTQDRVERVAQQCGLRDFITSLPDGYHTECGSVGNSTLSGGQRQRLSLARALIKDPEVLLLDEPTASLDAHSEREVQAALAEAAKDRTTIMIAHRLASIQHVDRIFVFDQGKIVEHGTHTELVQLGGLYASMARVQGLTE